MHRRLSWLLLVACATSPDAGGPASADTDASEDSDVAEDPDPVEPTDEVPDTDGDTAADPDPAACAYPADPAEPMALMEPLSPYSWPRALHADGRDLPLRLSEVPCATDPDIDWSPFDLLLFVSIPAW